MCRHCVWVVVYRSVALNDGAWPSLFLTFLLLLGVPVWAYTIGKAASIYAQHSRQRQRLLTAVEREAAAERVLLAKVDEANAQGRMLFGTMKRPRRLLHLTRRLWPLHACSVCGLCPLLCSVPSSHCGGGGGGMCLTACVCVCV